MHCTQQNNQFLLNKQQYFKEFGQKTYTKYQK